jgi:hypothetical protein
MRFVRIAQIELSRPPTRPWTFRTDVDGVSLRIQPREADELPMRRCLIFAEVPIESQLVVDSEGMIVVDEDIVRQTENAIERFADLAAVATFSTRRITSAVPAAGFSDVTSADRDWLIASAGFSQPVQRSNLIPAAIDIADPVLAALNDRRDGVELLAEALGSTHETRRFREFVRFFERAFAASPPEFVNPLSDFLGYFDRLEYTRDEIAWWHQLRNQASHGDRSDRQYVLSREARPELAAYDVLFNKLNWNQSDSTRRDIWDPPGGVLSDELHVIIQVHASVKIEAEPFLDGFGAYPYDRSCKIESYPSDWWLDTSFRVKTQIPVESVGSLHSS